MTVFQAEFASWEDAFQSALKSLNLPVPENIQTDGNIHRFSINGKKNNTSGWYIVFNDEIIGGCVGNWATGEKKNFYYSKTYCSQDQIKSLSLKWEEARKKADIKRNQIAEETALKAKEKWLTLLDANENHPYLIRKKIKPHSLKLGKQRLYSKIEDEFGNIVSLQSIDDKGQKLFMEGGRIKGCYSLIGTPTDVLYVAEGYATAASIHEATGLPVAAALSASNINDCIISLKKRYPSASLTICADSDDSGKKYAEAAEKIHNIPVIFPPFTPEDLQNHGKLTDFNDYVSIYGKEKLRELIINTKNKNKLNFLTINDILKMPKVDWLIKNVFPINSFGIIYGAPKSGKTFVALDMALSIASGLPWHDCDVSQGSVLYIAGEGVGGLPKRIKAWIVQNKIENNNIPFYVLPVAINMMAPEEVQNLIENIKELNQSFSMIVVDTVARSILGADENSSEHMGKFVSACDSIRNKTKSMVLGIHHSGKDEERGMRGSSALHGAVDTSIFIKRDEDNLMFEVQDQKDGEPIENLCFKMNKIILGIDEISIGLELSENTPQNKKIHSLSFKEKKALQILMDSVSQSSKILRGAPAAEIEFWRSECYRRELTIGNIESKRSGFRSVSTGLQSKGRITMESGLVTIINDN